VRLTERGDVDWIAEVRNAEFILLIMSLAMIAPCDAATHSFTVEQLKQKLAAQQTAGKNDDSCAQQLNSLKMTEQLTSLLWTALRRSSSPARRPPSR